MSKKLFILLTFFVVLGLVVPNVVLADVIEVRVAAGEDDSEEDVATGAIDITSSDLEITEEGEPALNQLVGMRFNGVAIPQGATITSAYVQFQVDETDVPGDNRPGTKFLKGEASDNAAALTTTAFDISSRPTTTAEASWDWPEWLIVDEEGPDQQTSDISAVIQEIVDRPGWASGNSLVLIITGSGENCAEAYEGEPEAAALLHVEFSGSGAPAADGPTGTIMYELWMNIGGTAMEDLTGNANFPDNPTSGELVTLFETPTDIADNFGGRIYGWLHPATSGDYTFWIATDDDGDLLLSTDADPANAVVICGVDGWAPARAFDGEAGSPGTRQMSAPIALVGGQKYYIEGRYKEGGGGDNLAVAWQGPDSPDRSVIDGAFLSPAPWNVNLLKAKDPNPADGTVDADTTSLEWVPSPSAVSFKVYLSSDATIDDSDLVAETNLTIHLVALDIGATYYWRVDVVEADGTIREGNVWSFTTLPLEAHFPSPADGAGSQPLDSKLRWTGGKGVIMHDLYFGTDEALVAAGDPSTFKGKLMVTSYDPGALNLETTYYWKVDEFSVTGTNAGPVWSFSTIGSVPITDPDLLLYYDFERGEGDVAIDQSGHSNHGQFMGDPQWAIGYLGGGLDFDGDGDYLDAGTNDQLNSLSDAITVSAWVNIRSVTTTWMGIVMKGETAWRLGVNGDTTGIHWGFTGGDRGWQQANSVTELPLDEWHFITATYDNTVGATVYVDGVAEATNPDLGGLDTNTQPLLIGENPEATGRLFDGILDEVRIYNKALTDVEIIRLMGAVSDVTAPGDVVKGVPDEARDGSVAGWPDNEHPALALDDNVSTKFLHFRGEVSPTGFVVEPALGASIVTGLTFTTANDATERDPISFELSGSNDSIDGPYTLIASGDIVDFAQETAWPRFTMNATPITFDNTVAYAYYQVMFPTVRNPGSANSMQIAEVELLGVPAPIARWEFDGDFGGGTPYGDISFEDDPVRGKVLSLPGGDNQYVDLGSVGISGNMPRTITVWAKADNTSIPDWTLIFGFTGDADGNGGNGSHFNIGSLGGPGGVGAHVWGWEETIFSDEEALEWHHYAMSYDGTTIQYYGDGDLLDTDPGKSNVRDLSISADRVHVGSRITQASSFPGKVDDARIYGQVLTQAQIRGVMTGFPPIPGATIIVVTQTRDNDADGVQDDQGLIDFLVAEGYNVDARIDNWVDLDADKIAALNAADLIIVSRASNSGDYDDGDEPTQWNSIDTPLILMNTYLVRTTRWLWMNTTTIPSVDFPIMMVTLPDHPYFEGVAVDADGIVMAIDGSVGMGRVSFVEAVDLGSGTLIAESLEGYPWIAQWEAGVEFYSGSGQTPAATRVMFSTGTQEIDSTVDPQGAHNLTADGEQILHNMIKMMLIPGSKEASLISAVVRSNGASGDRDPVGPYDGSTAPLATEPGGLMDGNLVFSDRTYPWAGVPAEYVGTEYIRTYNSDKNGGLTDVTYEVTISRPAIVWITVDDRIPAEWNAGGAIASPQDAADYVTAAFAAPGTFTDSGIDLFVREASDGSNDRPMSVYVAELSAGTYVFGSMDSGKNFYSIGAVE